MSKITCFTDEPRLRVYDQNVPVCTGTTRTCVSTCAHGASTHGDVLNVHTETSCLDTGFSGCHTPHTTTQHNTTAQPQHHTETETETDRDRERRQGQKEKRRRKRRDKTREEKTKEDKTRQEKREDSFSVWWCINRFLLM